jgi:hypothetical protein
VGAEIDALFAEGINRLRELGTAADDAADTIDRMTQEADILRRRLAEQALPLAEAIHRALELTVRLI